MIFLNKNEISDDDIQKICQYAMSGLNDVEIAKMLDYPKHVIRSIRIQNHIPANNRASTFSFDTLYTMVYDNGLTDQEIADIFHVSNKTVQKYRTKYKIYRKKSADYIDADTLRQLVDDGYSDQAIGKKYHCSAFQVSMRRKELGIFRADRHLCISEEDIAEIRQMVNQGMSDTEIGKRLGKSKTTIWQYRKLYNIVRTTKEKQLHYISDDELRNLIDQGLSDTEIAKQTGYAISSVHSRRASLGILRRTTKRTNISAEELQSLIDCKMTDQQIADHFDCGICTIQERRQELGIQQTPRALDIPIDQVLDMYINQHLSANKIAEHFGCSPSTILARLHNHANNQIRHSHIAAHNDEWENFAEYVNTQYVQTGHQLSINQVADYFQTSHNTVMSKINQQHVEQYFILHNEYSQSEDVWRKWLNSIGMQQAPNTSTTLLQYQYIHNDRSILQQSSGHNLEIDFYFPIKRLGIEINPYWTHCSDNLRINIARHTVPQRYHQHKAMLAAEAGINLIQAYDYFDIAKIQNLILYHLGLLKTVCLDQCTIEQVSIEAAMEFVNNNLLYNMNAMCSSAIGLFNQNDLIAIACFQPHDQYIEITKAGLCQGVKVIGNWLQALIIQYVKINDNRNNIFHIYSHLDISNGTFYLQSGFSYIRTLKPNYVWVNTDTSVVLTAKQTSDKTNAEMYAAGFSRLFDAGMQEYMINVSSVEQ